MSIFRQRRYGVTPSVARASVQMSAEMVRFLDFVMNAAIVVLTAWSILFYLSVCLPSLGKLNLALSISFLLIPMFFFQLDTFQREIETRRWSEAQLGRLGWVLARWVRECIGFMGEIIAVFSIVYVVLRLLMKVFVWPNSLFGWIATRIDAFLGVSVASLSGGNRTGWIASWAYTIIAGLYLINFLYLWVALAKLAVVSAMVDTQFVDEKVLSPSLYGGFARWLWGSFVLAVVLSVCGALYKIYSGIGAVMGWSITNFDLDWFTRVLGSPQSFGITAPWWWNVLHVPLALTIVRVLFLRLPYVQSILSATWGSEFNTIGSVVLVLPVFYQVALSTMPVGHFYDGYLVAAQCVYAITYVAFLIPMFGLMIGDRVKAAARP